MFKKKNDLDIFNIKVNGKYWIIYINARIVNIEIFLNGKGKSIMHQELITAQKYKTKPEGVLFTIKQDKQDRIGKYTACPCYEPNECFLKSV